MTTYSVYDDQDLYLVEEKEINTLIKIGNRLGTNMHVVVADDGQQR
jgi:hypothetical protein